MWPVTLHTLFFICFFRLGKFPVNGRVSESIINRWVCSEKWRWFRHNNAERRWHFYTKQIGECLISFFFQKCLFCIYLFFFSVGFKSRQGWEGISDRIWLRAYVSRRRESCWQRWELPGLRLGTEPPPLSTPNQPCLFSFLSSWLDHGILIEFWKKATKTKKNIYKHKKEILVLRSTISFNPQFVCFFQIKNPPSILYITYV